MERLITEGFRTTDLPDTSLAQEIHQAVMTVINVLCKRQAFGPIQLCRAASEAYTCIPFLVVAQAQMQQRHIIKHVSQHGKFPLFREVRIYSAWCDKALMYPMCFLPNVHMCACMGLLDCCVAGPDAAMNKLWISLPSSHEGLLQFVRTSAASMNRNLHRRQPAHEDLCKIMSCRFLSPSAAANLEMHSHDIFRYRSCASKPASKHCCRSAYHVLQAVCHVCALCLPKVVTGVRLAASKVQDEDLVAGCDKDVALMQVVVKHACLMDPGQSLTQPLNEGSGLGVPIPSKALQTWNELKHTNNGIQQKPPHKLTPLIYIRPTNSLSNLPK